MNSSGGSQDSEAVNEFPYNQLTEAVQMVKKPYLSQCQLFPIELFKKMFHLTSFLLCSFLRYTNYRRQNSSLSGIEYLPGWETLLSQHQISLVSFQIKLL